MDRKKYWNNDYVTYWKAVTDEAEDSSSVDSKIQKVSGHDFKTQGIDTITSFFDKLDYQANDKLLDYGCGFGRLYPYFSNKCDYYGIDISSAMIDECIKRFPEANNKFIVAEGEHLPFQNEHFEKIMCVGVFDACYQEQALTEMLRTTRKGGVLVISGKNNHYFQDDEEAYIAEINARKKGHPNYFTDVRNMLEQLKPYCQILEQQYALRRGDFVKSVFYRDIPERFYEWKLIIKKVENLNTDFTKLSDEYSRTFTEKAR